MAIFGLFVANQRVLRPLTSCTIGRFVCVCVWRRTSRKGNLWMGFHKYLWRKDIGLDSWPTWSMETTFLIKDWKGLHDLLDYHPKSTCIIKTWTLFTKHPFQSPSIILFRNPHPTPLNFPTYDDDHVAVGHEIKELITIRLVCYTPGRSSNCPGVSGRINIWFVGQFCPVINAVSYNPSTTTTTMSGSCNTSGNKK